MGDDVSSVGDTTQEVVIFWVAAFFRARYSRCFLLISSLCSMDISARRFRCAAFLSSLLRLALSRVAEIHIGDQQHIA